MATLKPPFLAENEYNLRKAVLHGEMGQVPDKFSKELKAVIY